MKKKGLLLYLMLVLVFLVANGFGQGVPAPYTARLQPFLTGLNRPILIRTSRDGTKRLFIVQQGGIIKVLQPGSTTPTDFINLASRITVPTSGGDERGLLGLAFHPQFATNGKFYCYFNRVNDSANTLVEYRTTTGTGSSNTGDITTERTLFSVTDPFSNHNGGMLEFGPDGYLYAGLGDGGSSNDPGNRAQNKQVLLGKLLRIDVNVPIGSTDAYSIPPTNPFVGAGTARCDTGTTTATACQEIWTFGMRNPWRWSFDRGGNNALWVADVGQGSREEVDVITSGGGNYGWRIMEGTACTNNDVPLCIPSNFVAPLFDYTHSGSRCSITGGYVYRGTQGSLPFGAYTYGDYCSGEFFIWNSSAQVLLQDTPRNILSFGEDDDGEIYICYNTGATNGQIDKIARARASGDFDGDFKTDLAVYRPSETYWYVNNSSNGTVRADQFGNATDIPTPEDFDGDSITDVAVFRPESGVWYFLRSTTHTLGAMPFGSNGDVPAAGDYDGDAKSDFTVFRPSNGGWYTLRSSDLGFSAVQFGTSEDIPVAGDYDGDGKYDVAVFRPSSGVWYRLNSMNSGFNALQFGALGDIPTQGDYDGDGRNDISVFRPSTGVWYSIRSVSGFQATQWGQDSDIPVAGDYDGDGREDLAVFRPSIGVWYQLRSTSGFTAMQFGASGDAPAPRYDTP